MKSKREEWDTLILVCVMSYTNGNVLKVKFDTKLARVKSHKIKRNRAVVIDRTRTVK